MTARRMALPGLQAGGSVRESVALVVALLLAMMMAPVAATAAGTLVSIVDPSSGAKAHVSDGKLQVGDGSGALTINGNVNVGNLPNPQPVAGTVNVRQAAGAPALAVQVQNTAGAPVPVSGMFTVTAPQDPWHAFVQGNNVTTLTLFDSPGADTDLAISSFTIVNGGDVVATVKVEISGNCQAAPAGEITELTVGPMQTSHVEYPQPLVAHLATGNACVLAEINGNGATRITGVGFST